MNKDKTTNWFWTVESIAKEYKKDNPQWTETECYEKAREINKELNRMNNQLWKSNGTYYKNNTPFSFYESEDGTWSSISSLSEI